ncbi:SMI1/KNR4 family protein [Streptomyces justiciae]|uniref:SMI1/KNR4 family protein n=1 Tax=Streptomyces justiciae TaxID=2780140 RepID=A0ABU3LXT3_9ACTN|nr:hypothetical protein [Streptomyces justiciae]MDT7843352.1 hypothetical protein [Streptomyces justiciae]
MSGERLDAEWVRDWCERSSSALSVLMPTFLETHGFAPDENVVTLATDESHAATGALVELTPIPSDLTTLYWVICEVSLPDVGNGYFVHSASMVADHFREYGSVPIADEWPALVFASDGGGHLFAVTGSGRVWRSTTASWFDDFEVVAPSVQEFLERIGREVAVLGDLGAAGGPEPASADASGSARPHHGGHRRLDGVSGGEERAVDR